MSAAFFCYKYAFVTLCLKIYKWQDYGIVLIYISVDEQAGRRTWALQRDVWWDWIASILPGYSHILWPGGCIYVCAKDDFVITILYVDTVVVPSHKCWCLKVVCFFTCQTFQLHNWFSTMWFHTNVFRSEWNYANCSALLNAKVINDDHVNTLMEQVMMMMSSWVLAVSVVSDSQPVKGKGFFCFRS